MVRKIAVLLLSFYIFGAMGAGAVFAQVGEDAEKKAEEIHKRAISDVIYIDEELKALYYQNVRIIELLKETRDILRQQLEGIEEGLKELEEIKKDLRSIKEKEEKVE